MVLFSGCRTQYGTLKNKRYPENHEEDHEDRRELCMIPGAKGQNPHELAHKLIGFDLNTIF